MNHCVEYAAGLNYKWLVGSYRPTAKNTMVKDFYAQFGFAPAPSADGSTQWRLRVDSYHTSKVYLRSNGMVDVLEGVG